jgi:hypothetical protein
MKTAAKLPCPYTEPFVKQTSAEFCKWVTIPQYFFPPYHQAFARLRSPTRATLGCILPSERTRPPTQKTMATERQIQANRANAKRSTGPVTEEGKQASSQNARRHDQLSSCVVLKAESTPLFDDLMDSLIAEFQPQTANETALVETMAVARWKLWRNWTFHTALLELETVKQDQSVGNAPVINALAFKTLADSSHSLHLLHRYEVSLDRQYSRALNNLLKVRAAPKENPPPPPPPVIEAAALNPEPAAADVEIPPKQALPNKANLPSQPALKPVEILRRRPVSTPVTTSSTVNRPVQRPKTAHPTPPTKK